jgi:hypothetical protein
VRLAFARLRRRPERALVAAGVACAAGALAGVLAASVTAQDRSLARAVGELPPESRAVRAAWFGVPGPGERYVELDHGVRAALRPVLGREPVATVLFRESTIAGAFATIGGVEGLGRFVRLLDGRLPRPCRRQRCEVLQLRGRGRLPDAPGLRLARVGRAELPSARLFGDAIRPARTGRAASEVSAVVRARGYHQPPPAPLLLAEGTAALAASPALTTVYRSYGWVLPLEGGDVHPWGVNELLASLGRARSSLGVASFAFDLNAPGEELTSARDTGRVAGRRLLLLGGQAVALLLAFAVLAGVRMRRDSETAFRRLTWLGARRWQLGLLALAEAALLAVPGGLVGWTAGTAVAAAVAGAAGSPAAEVVRNSVASRSGLGLAALLAAAATVLLTVAVAVRPLRVRGLGVSPLDVLAAAALAVAIVAAAGGMDADSLARERGTGAFLLLLPALVAFGSAVAAARLLPLVLRAVARVVPGRLVGLRLATLSLARRPGHAAVGVAFLTVSVGLALFAESYRATLVRGQHDEAAFAVPVAAVVREDLSRLIPVRNVDARPLARHAEVLEATRLSSSLAGAAGQGGIVVLGLPPRALARLDGWRSDFSARPLDELAGLLGPERSARLRGPRLPADAQTLSLAVRSSGPPVGLSAAIQRADGDFSFVELARGRGRMRGRIPREARGGTLVGLRLQPPRRVVEPGADAGLAAAGVVSLGPLVVNERALVPGYSGWIATGGLERQGQARLAFRLASREAARFRPRQHTDGRVLAALVTPRLAALADREGRLPIRLGGETVRVRVAATVERFPGTLGDVIVVERGSLVTALNAANPGTGFTTELWLDAARPSDALALERRLAQPPYDVLAVDSRSALDERLQSEPIARGSLLLLVASALVAIALTLVSVTLGLVADVRDSRAELYDLEAQGAAPAGLRRQLAVRALVVAAAGLVSGLVAGAALSRLAVGLVSLTAGAADAEPPLVLVVDWAVVAGGLVAAAAAVGIVLAGISAAAFRGPTAGRFAEEAP